MNPARTQYSSILGVPDELTDDLVLEVPLPLRRGSLREDQKASVESGIHNLKGVATRTGRSDWSNTWILDYGCGVKFTQTLVQFGIPVGAYVGMDVHKGIIGFLQNADLPEGFHFEDVPFHNEMYNRNGVPLTAESDLPGPFEAYDLITLQSVFTHFAPDDFQNMLHVLRRYAADDARMLFTCMIDNDLETDFFDSVPGRPLLKALYREDKVRDMVAAAGWAVESFHGASFSMQPHFVCRPA